MSPATALAVGLKVDADALPADVLEGDQARARQSERSGGDAGAARCERRRRRDRLIATATAASRRSGSSARSAIRRSTTRSRRASAAGSTDGRTAISNVGAIVALAPDLSAVADLLQTDQATVRTVLNSWGPGKFDAQLFLDGKAFRPDGKSAATLIPAAFGLAGVNLHTYTGWGGVSHWNAFVANLEMHGKGTFIDARLDDPLQFPGRRARRIRQRAQRSGSDHVEAAGAAVLPALDSGARAAARLRFDARAAERGKARLQRQRALLDAATCRRSSPSRAGTCTPPQEIGIDDFQASRSPDQRYRTTPLAGLFTRQKGGFYHDGRFANCAPSSSTTTRLSTSI